MRDIGKDRTDFGSSDLLCVYINIIVMLTDVVVSTECTIIVSVRRNYANNNNNNILINVMDTIHEAKELIQFFEGKKYLIVILFISRGLYMYIIYMRFL